MNEIAERLQEALSRYQESVAAHATALHTRLVRKNVLDEAVAVARANGEIEGKNEAERDGHARQMYAGHYSDLETAETDLIAARAALDQAEAELQVAHTLANLSVGRGTLLEAA